MYKFVCLYAPDFCRCVSVCLSRRCCSFYCVHNLFLLCSYKRSRKSANRKVMRQTSEMSLFLPTNFIFGIIVNHLFACVSVFLRVLIFTSHEIMPRKCHFILRATTTSQKINTNISGSENCAPRISGRRRGNFCKQTLFALQS